MCLVSVEKEIYSNSLTVPCILFHPKKDTRLALSKYVPTTSSTMLFMIHVPLLVIKSITCITLRQLLQSLSVSPIFPFPISFC